ncbi:MAG: hypothetical protein QM775_36545 [Pirellulales bacterium]
MRAALTVCGLVLWTLSLSASLAQADIPPPPADLPEGKDSYDLRLTATADKDVSFLRIPKGALPARAQAANNAQGNWSPQNWRTIAAGLCLSAGIAAVFLVRGKNRYGAAAALIALSLFGATTLPAWGNAAPPSVREQPGAAFQVPADGFHGVVVVEIVDDGPIELVVGTKPKPKYKRVLPPGER